MSETLWGIVTIGGPIILLLVFVWVVIRSKRRAGEASEATTERATRANYQAEERTHDSGREGDA
jgi:cytochrome c-type biogenesis protein CcmH/NrfF